MSVPSILLPHSLDEMFVSIQPRTDTIHQNHYNTLQTWLILSKFNDIYLFVDRQYPEVTLSSSGS